jgi:hypothetical protein
MNIDKVTSAQHHTIVTSLIHATRTDVRQGLISPFQDSTSLKTLLTWIVASIRNGCAKAGHRVVTVLRWLDRTAGDAKQGLVQGFRRIVFLPVTATDINHALWIPPSSQGLRVPARNLEALWKRNADNVHCVCWDLCCVTDPTTRFMGIIRWFDGELEWDPPYDLIVSTLEARFESASSATVNCGRLMNVLQLDLGDGRF